MIFTQKINQYSVFKQNTFCSLKTDTVDTNNLRLKQYLLLIIEF